MSSLLVVALALAAPNTMPTDACVTLVPDALRQELARRFHDVRLPLASDSPSEDSKNASAHADACVLIAKADFNGDGKPDLVLVLPRKEAAGYRLVVALNSPAGFKVMSLESWHAPVTNLNIDVATPGTYSHTEAYAFQPEAGVAERIVSARAGFWFGEREGGADVYFLKDGRWIRVHAVD
jgi:hypothetical protein